MRVLVTLLSPILIWLWFNALLTNRKENILELTNGKSIDAFLASSLCNCLTTNDDQQIDKYQTLEF